MRPFSRRAVSNAILVCWFVLASCTSLWADSAPPGISFIVNPQAIAEPLSEGVPIVEPVIPTEVPGAPSPTASSVTSQASASQSLTQVSAGAQSYGCASPIGHPAPLVALVAGLKCDPDLIFEYIYNNIEFEPLYGSNKGPLGTLLDRRGDDADQAILFVTLLNIAGYTQTGYANILTQVSGSAIANWLGVKNDATAITSLFRAGGIPYTNAIPNSDGTLASIQFLHFWAALQLNGIWYYFDPSFKQHTIVAGIANPASALGYDRTQFLSDAGGTLDSISISNVNRGSLRSDLVKYASNLVTYINQNDRTWTVANIIGGKLIRPLSGSPVRRQFPGLTPSSSFPANCPNQTPSLECRTSVTLTMPGASSSQAIKFYTDQVYGHRITVFSTPSGTNFYPTLLIDGTPPSCVAAGTCTNVGPATAPGAQWSIPVQIVGPNQPSSTGCSAGATACNTLRVVAGSSYLVGLGAGRMGRNMVDYHRQLLAQARAAGNADGSELVLGESLAVISCGWLAELSATQAIIDELAQVTSQYHFATGIVGQANIQQSGFKGPYVDLPVNYVSPIARSSTGPTTTIGGVSYLTAFAAAAGSISQAMSSFESAVLEQTQAPVAGMTAASTIKLIDSNMDPSYAGALVKSYFADGTTTTGRSTYTSTILPAITPQYSSSDLNEISNAVASGSQVLIPAYGKLTVGSWIGSGHTEILPQVGALTVSQKITGGMSGGFSGVNVENPAANAEVTLPPSANSDTSNSLLNTISSTMNWFVAEPVDGITGAYVYKNTDLTTGSGQFPYALDFSRTYLSSSGSSLTTTTSDIGIGNGWAHNWSSNVQIQSDPYLGIGVYTSPALSAATSIAALYVMNDLMSVTPTVQTATISSMVARWFTDQLTGNVAIVTQPDTAEEFIALPRLDGATSLAFNPPSGSSARLNQVSAGRFTYARKDGVTSNYGPFPSGGLQSVVYPNGASISLSYSGSTSMLNRLANNLGRSLSFTYNGPHVSSVTDDSGRSISLNYDGSGNLSSVTDPSGATTTFAYDTSGNFDSLGHLTQVFYPANPANAFVVNWYDPLGRVIKQANASGSTSSFYFAGSRTETVDPLLNRHVTYQTDRGRVVSDAYVLSSSFGNVFNDTVQQNGLINVTRTQYDGLDRLVSTVFPEGGSISYSYATSLNPWANNVATVTTTPKPGSPLSAQATSYTYDPIYNKPTSIIDPLGLITSLAYDPFGNLATSISDAGTPPHFNARSTFAYNDQGQTLSATNQLGVTTRYGYDSFGNQISIVRDAGGGRLNQQTTFVYSPSGDAIRATDPKGNVTTNTYDANRRLVSTVAPNGLTTRLTYDANGQLTQTQQSVAGASLRTTSSTYTLTGKVGTTTDANNNTTTQIYDGLDRVARIIDPMGRIATYGYDALGRQVSVSNPAIQSTPLLQKAYTPDGLMASLTDANGHSTSFAYDGLDRLATTTYPLGSTETFTYDADNNVLTRKTRANQTISFTYDTLNRLKTNTPPSPAPVVTYSYDLAGRLTSVSDTSAAIAAAVPPGGLLVQYAASYGYDAMNRPISVNWTPAPAQATPAASSVTFAHSYNKANQRVGQTATDNTWLNYPAATPSTTSYAANALNQYIAVGAVSPSYDGNGNLTSDGTLTLGYDAENRLTSASGAGNTASYKFDAQGRRKTKTVNGATTVFVTDADNREVLEYDGSTGAIQRWYAYGLGPNAVLSQMNVAAATRATLVPDMLGSIVGSLDSGATSLTKVGYLPYGKSGSAGPFGFTGQRIDLETSGLYYYRTRHYSPAWGRFLQGDPIGYDGGSHLYAYVNNDPLNATDPSGLFCNSSGGNLSCTSPGGISFTVPSPVGFPNSLGPGQTNYHAYNVPVNAGSVSAPALMTGVTNSPTPGSSHPATAAGTLNDATPSAWSAAAYIAVGALTLGQASPGNISPVMSYATTDQNGNPIVVNVTQAGHPLDPGYVVRYATTNANGQTVLNNEGEGTGLLQSPSSPVANFINNQWQSQSHGIINKLK